MLTFSTCWNDHRHTLGDELVNEVILLGFEAIEVSHGTDQGIFPGLEDAVRTGRIRVVGGQNLCARTSEELLGDEATLEFTSEKEEERERAIKLSLKSINTIAGLDGDYFVLNLGSSTIQGRSQALEALVKSGRLNDRRFVKEKIEYIRDREAASPITMDRIRLALDHLLPYAEEKCVTLGIKIPDDYGKSPTERELQKLLEEYPSARLGYWHDFGHVQRNANLDFLDHAETLQKFSSRLVGCHLRDCEWPDRDQLAPFSGDIEFQNLMPLLPDGIPVVWNLAPSVRSADIKSSLQKWKDLHK